MDRAVYRVYSLHHSIHFHLYHRTHPHLHSFMHSCILTSQNNLKDKKTDEGYVPKKSRRLKRKSTAPADGDTWTEYVVIVDKAANIKRSYFKSKLTNRCVWDEPPSGASNIILFPEQR